MSTQEQLATAKKLRSKLQDWSPAVVRAADELFWPHRAAMARVEGYYYLLLAARLEDPEQRESATDLVLHRLAPALDELNTLEIKAYRFLNDAVIANVREVVAAMNEAFPEESSDPTGKKLADGLMEHLDELDQSSQQYPDKMAKKLAAANRILLASLEESERGKATLDLVRWQEGLAHYANTSSMLGAVSSSQPLPGSEKERDKQRTASAIAEVLAELVKEYVK